MTALYSAACSLVVGAAEDLAAEDLAESFASIIVPKDIRLPGGLGDFQQTFNKSCLL